MFQYVEPAVGIWAIPKYLFNASSAAVVPPPAGNSYRGAGLKPERFIASVAVKSARSKKEKIRPLG